MSHCATLGIPLEAASLDEVLSKAENESLSHLLFFDLLLGAQANARRERALAHRIREARFAEDKTLEGFDWQFNPKAFDRVQIEELATGYLARKRLSSIALLGQEPRSGPSTACCMAISEAVDAGDKILIRQKKSWVDSGSGSLPSEW